MKEGLLDDVRGIGIFAHDAVSHAVGRVLVAVQQVVQRYTLAGHIVL